MTLVNADRDVHLYAGDAVEILRTIPTHYVSGVVTSPPYLTARPEYGGFDRWRELFSELRRVARGGVILNVGRLWSQGVENLWWVAVLEAAREEGLELVDTAIWAKPNANPIIGNVLTNAHEYLFLLNATGREPFYPDELRTDYAPDSLARMGRRYVSSVSVKGDTAERNGPRREAKRGMRLEADTRGARATSIFVHPTGAEKGNPHPAPMPIALALELVALATPEGGTVLDPFAGSGTTLRAARALGRLGIGIELDFEYAALAAEYLAQQSLLAEELA